MNKDKEKFLTIYFSPFGYGKTYYELFILQKENQLLKKENKELISKIKFNEKSRRKMQQSLMKKIEKYNNIKEMFESGVVDLEKLKNIVLGDE